MHLPFKVDKRFKLCTRDMFITFAFLALYAIFILGTTYGLGGKPLREYKFYFGMPSWFFISTVGMIIFIIALGFISLKVFADMPVDAYITDEGDDHNA